MLAVLFAIFTLLYQLLNLPDPERLGQIVQSLYDLYGMVALFIAAFIEAIFMVNIYFPGSFMIVLAVFLSPKTVASLFIIALIAWLGFMLAGFVNYWLGNKGFYKILLFLGKRDIVEKMQAWMKRRGKYAVFLAASHPNVLAITQICMGISRVGIIRNIILSGLTLAFWVPLWTIFFAFISKSAEIAKFPYGWYMMGLFILWGIIAIVLKQIKLRARETER